MSKGRLPVFLATGAVAWSVLAIAAAFWVPVYSTEGASSSSGGSSQTAAGSATLVEVNGMLPVVILGVLAGVAVICWIGLHARCAHGSLVGTVVAWVAAGLLLAFSMISFGLWILTLPIAVMMLTAAATTPAGEPSRS
jgi:hypothetical protein